MNRANNNNSESQFSQEDLAQLFNYPSVGELFSENNHHRLDEFRQKLISTRDNLDRLIRYGKPDQAESATKSVRAIEVTLEFLQTLQNIRTSDQK